MVVTAGTIVFVCVPTTSRSKIGNFRPPTKSPRPALRGDVRPAGGRLRPPAFILHFFLLLHPPSALGILLKVCSALTWSQTPQHGGLGLLGAGMPPCCEKRHTGLHRGNGGVSGRQVRSVLRTQPPFDSYISPVTEAAATRCDPAGSSGCRSGGGCRSSASARCL